MSETLSVQWLHVHVFRELLPARALEQISVEECVM